MDQIIQENLQAPIKSFRIFALEQAIQRGNSPELLQELQNQAVRETDDECLLLLPHAVAAVSSRIAPGSPASAQPIRPFEEQTEEERIAWLTLVTPRQAGSFRKSVPGWFASNRSSLIRTLLVKKFGGVWPEESLPALVNALSDDSLSLRIAILDALSRVRPLLLKPRLPDLLRGEDPGLRFLAIRILAAIDVAEAVKFLGYYLLKGDSAEKLAGIQLSFYLPFEQIKPVLLQFFSLENDSRLLTRAALLFSINPDREVPFRLWEIAETSAQDKKAFLRKVVQSACAAIKTSEMLGGELPEFIAHLQGWIRSRVINQLLQRLLNALEESPEIWDAMVDEDMLARLRTPEGRESLQAARSWSLTSNQAGILDRLSQAALLTSGTSPKKTFEEKEFLRSSEEEQIRMLREYPLALGSEIRPVLPRLITEFQGRNVLLAEVIRLALRLKDFSQAASCALFLQSNNPGLQEAAVEFFLSADPMQVIPLLGGFLNSANPRVQSLALQALKTIDQSRALEIIKGMLDSPRSEVKRQALHNLGYLDFSVVRETLAAFLKGCQDLNCFRMALCLFEANPDSRNLFFLYQIRNGIAGDRVALLETLCQRTEERLVAEGQITPDELAALKTSFSEEVKKEEDKRISPPAYAFQRIKTTPKKEGSSWENRLIGFFTSPGKLSTAIVLIVVGGLGLFLWSQDFAREFSPPPVRFPSTPSVVTVEGTVIKSDRSSREFCIKTVAGDQYLVYPDQAPWDAFPDGTRVRAQLTPIRMNSRNQLLCEGKKFDRF